MLTDLLACVWISTNEKISPMGPDIVQQLQTWKAAYPDYSALRITNSDSLKNEHRLPMQLAIKADSHKSIKTQSATRNASSTESNQSRGFSDKEKTMILNYARNHSLFSNIQAPQKLCQGILDFYASHANSPEWLKDITVLPAIQHPRTANSLSAAAIEIPLDWAIGLCADLLQGSLDHEHHEYSAQALPLHHAFQQGHSEIARLLIARGVDPSARDHAGDTPLVLAILHNHVQAAKVLIQNGANLEQRSKSYRYYNAISALELAARNGNSDIVRQLLGEPELEDPGYTLLHLAATRCETTTIAEQLLQYGADFNARDGNGSTALHLAAKNKNPGTVKLLIRRGADITAVDNQGRTPIDLANQAGCTQCTGLLRSAHWMRRITEAANTILHPLNEAASWITPSL